MPIQPHKHRIHLRRPIEIACLLELEDAGTMLLKAGARVPVSLQSSKVPSISRHATGNAVAGLTRALQSASHAPSSSSPVKTLKWSCRSRVLRALGTSVQEKLKTLPPLDYETRQYLRFSELDEHDDRWEQPSDHAPSRSAADHAHNSPLKRGVYSRSTYAGKASTDATPATRLPEPVREVKVRSRTTSTSSSRVSSGSDGSASRSSVRRSPNYQVNGRIGSTASSPTNGAATHATSPTPSIDYANVYRKTRSPLDVTTGPTRFAVTPATARCKDRTLSTDNGYVSTDSESTPEVRGVRSRRAGKARSAVISLSDMVSTKCGGSRAARADQTDARIEHRNALNREADEFARKADFNNNNNGMEDYDTTSRYSQSSSVELDVLSPVLRIIESQEQHATPASRHATRPNSLAGEKSKRLHQEQQHRASVNVGRDWANSLRTSSSSIAATTPLGKVTPLGKITPTFGRPAPVVGKVTPTASRTSPAAGKTTPTRCSQRRLSDRLSQTGSARKKSVSGSPSEPLQCTLTPQHRVQKLSGGRSSLQLSQRRSSSTYVSESGL